MYRKKDKKVTVIAAVVVVFFIAIIYIIPNFHDIFIGSAGEEETEEKRYEVLIHKTDAGRIDVQKSLLEKDADTETTLSVTPGTLVSLNVTPGKNKELTGVSAVDAKDLAMQYNTILTKTRENTYTVDFAMPESDVVMSFTFETMETEETERTPTYAETDQMQSESEAEEGNPYGLILHGISADLITSFNGQFDDRDFCQQLGDTLHPDLPGSEYFGIRDVTFLREAYAGEKDPDKVYCYICFNADPENKMLAVYYLKDETYVFTKAVVSEREEGGMEDTASSVSAMGDGENTAAAPAPGTTYVTSVPGKTTTTTFDILRVSRVFLDYTGDQGAFYDKAFAYVLSKGLTGSITGTMSSYQIYPEKKKAVITIRLNNGGTIKGTYRKDQNTFKFTGL